MTPDKKTAAANDKPEPGEPKPAPRRKGVVVTNEKKTVQAKYFFTEKEKKDLAGLVCQRQQELIEREDEKKAAAAGYTEKIKVIRLDISSASRKYRDGWEHRDYACTVVMDFTKREKRFVEVATKKVVDVQPFGPGDDQRRFL